MVARAGVDLRVNTTVMGIELLETGEKLVRYRSPPSDLDDALSARFDTVIFTAPYHQSSIVLDPPLRVEPEKIDYVTQHVTLFASANRPAPGFFNLTDAADVPDSILTTTPAGYNLSTRGSEGLGSNNKFWSLSTLRKLSVRNTTTGKDERLFLYKTFSPAPLTPSFFSKLFDLPAPTQETTAEEMFPWIHEQKFLAYPYHVPRRTFETFKLSIERKGAALQRVRPGDATIWYTTPFESFFSTMETSALSGRNVAKLIVQDLNREDMVKEAAQDALDTGVEGKQEL